eukprot:SAG31_NODE_46529_length_254_cov_0.664516_1_plen_32_part_10
MYLGTGIAGYSENLGCCDCLGGPHTKFKFKFR